MLPNISMHAVDMPFQGRDLRNKSGIFLYHEFLSRLVDVYCVMCILYTFSLKLNSQINEERGYLYPISYLKKSLS